MAVSFGCKCPECKKPVKERHWVVSQRCCHHSAFSGYRCTSSDYSEVFCLSCGAVGRTKARYVASLRDMRPSDEKKLVHPTHYAHSGEPIPEDLRT